MEQTKNIEVFVDDKANDEIIEMQCTSHGVVTAGSSTRMLWTKIKTAISDLGSTISSAITSAKNNINGNITSAKNEIISALPSSGGSSVNVNVDKVLTPLVTSLHSDPSGTPSNEIIVSGVSYVLVGTESGKWQYVCFHGSVLSYIYTAPTPAAGSTVYMKGPDGNFVNNGTIDSVGNFRLMRPTDIPKDYATRREIISLIRKIHTDQYDIPNTVTAADGATYDFIGSTYVGSTYYYEFYCPKYTDYQFFVKTSDGVAVGKQMYFTRPSVTTPTAWLAITKTETIKLVKTSDLDRLYCSESTDDPTKTGLQGIAGEIGHDEEYTMQEYLKKIFNLRGTNANATLTSIQNGMKDAELEKRLKAVQFLLHSSNETNFNTGAKIPLSIKVGGIYYDFDSFDGSSYFVYRCPFFGDTLEIAEKIYYVIAANIPVVGTTVYTKSGNTYTADGTIEDIRYSIFPTDYAKKGSNYSTLDQVVAAMPKNYLRGEVESIVFNDQTYTYDGSYDIGSAVLSSWVSGSDTCYTEERNPAIGAEIWLDEGGMPQTPDGDAVEVVNYYSYAKQGANGNVTLTSLAADIAKIKTALNITN